MAQDEGRAVYALDDIGHSESLARAGDAEKRLGRSTAVDACDKLVDRLWLVARRLVRGVELEIHNLQSYKTLLTYATKRRGAFCGGPVIQRSGNAVTQPIVKKISKRFVKDR